MRSVINALQYKQQSSGIGVMIRELFGRYSELTGTECTVVMPKDGPEFPSGNTTRLVRIPWKYSEGLKRMFFQSFLMGPKYCQGAVLLTTDSKLPFFLPRNCRVISVVTDLAVYRMRETYSFSRVVWWRFQYCYLRHRADKIIAISMFTKNELTKLFKIPENQIDIVSCACTPNMRNIAGGDELRVLKAKYKLPDHYVLFVGNTNPRKNLARMMQAFDEAVEAGYTDCQLIIAGDQGWKFDRVTALRAIKHGEAVRFIGFVPDEDMPALYSAAELFLFPSLYEGFGMPVLEAQTCGTPVLTSNLSSLPEVGGDGALYVDPYSVDSIRDGIVRILSDNQLSDELRAKGYENALRYSWDESARKLCRIVEEMD